MHKHHRSKSLLTTNKRTRAVSLDLEHEGSTCADSQGSIASLESDISGLLSENTEQVHLLLHRVSSCQLVVLTGLLITTRILIVGTRGRVTNRLSYSTHSKY